MKTVLDELGLKYASQFSTRTGFVIDFALFLEGRNIALEVDGERWHSSDKAKKRDRFRDYQLKREGWEVLRVREEELKDPISLREKVARLLAENEPSAGTP